MPTTRSPRENEDGAGATLIEFNRSAPLAPFTTAVSLHAHTNRSKEVMTMIPPYLDRVPIVAGLVRREMRRYERRHGRPVDFGKGWWHPPVDPHEVLASEARQIRTALGLRVVVSITDHDSIEAGLALRRDQPPDSVPVSFEWTVPFENGFFHVGVHNLPTASAIDMFEALSAYTQYPDAASLVSLLAMLDRDADTLLVLNHPLWDLAGVGPARHVALLQKFLAMHGDRMHALELNGYRSWAENTGVARLADRFSMPLVSGGDRHGCAPNSLLNLTTAESFGDFVREIREARRSVILVMPEYRRALVTRKLAVAADAMRRYPSYPQGRQDWTDRVSYERDGVVRPLSDHWPRGGPLWIRSTMRAFEIATSAPLIPALRALVWLVGASKSGQASPVSFTDNTVPVRRADASYNEIAG